MAWERRDKLAVTAIVIAILGIAISVYRVGNPQRAGCLVHLTSCPSRSGTPPSGSAGAASVPSPTISGLAPFPTPPGILPVGDNYASWPDPLPTPPTSPGTGQPRITVSPTKVVNRGTYAVIMVTGSGFTRNGTLSISLYDPEGGTYLAESGYPVDIHGNFRHAFLWYPLRGMDNNGTWAWTFQDQKTNKVVKASLQVTSNASTPPEDQWPVTYDLPSPGPPRARVTTSGNLCTGPGELTQVTASGFAPNANVTLYYLLPDGRYIQAAGESPDALGDIDAAATYWQIQNCQPGRQYRYTILVQDNNSGRSAKTTVVLSTG
jgi:hypothetical protein